MALMLTNLDDRTYVDLVREGMELIPRYAPEWTNHNASDPGITLLELFAFVSEAYLYRVDRITDASKAKYLKLLLGSETTFGRGESLDGQIQRALAEVHRPFRLISAEDFERCALEATRDGVDGVTVARVHCLPRRNLEAATETERQRDRPGHISLVLVPDDPWAPEPRIQLIKNRIREYAEPRRLLTCRVHVVSPRYVDAGLRIRVIPSVGHTPADVERRIHDDIARFFDPRRGGTHQSGWPLGRSVYVSDFYRRLGGLEGVSRLTAVEFDISDPPRLARDDMGDNVGVELKLGELLRIQAIDVRAESSDRL